jgi:cell division septal protein FtsQ
MFRKKPKTRAQMWQKAHPGPKKVMSRHTKTRIIYAMILMLLVSSVFGIIILLKETSFLRISKIIADGDNVFVANSYVADQISHVKGQYINNLNSQDLKDHILEKIPQIDDLTIDKRFPNTLIIFYQEHKIATRVQQDFNQPTYLISWNGQVVGTVKENDPTYDHVPLIHIPTEFVKIAPASIFPVRPGKKKDSQLKLANINTSIDIDIKTEDRTIAGQDRTEIGVAFDETVLEVIEPELVEAPRTLIPGNQIIQQDDIDRISKMKTKFGVELGLPIKEIWYYDVEREAHITLENNTKIKLSFEFSMDAQAENFIIRFKDEPLKDIEYKSIDLRVPYKVFTCDRNSCL